VSVLENSRVASLTDKQLIDAIRERGNDLRVLKSFAFLRRMFEKAAVDHPDCAKGLHVAVGLTMLYSKAFPCDPHDNPFPDLDGKMTVASLFEGCVPAPAEKFSGEVRRGAPRKARVEKVRLEPRIAGNVDFSAPKLKPKTVRIAQIMLAYPGTFRVKDIFDRCCGFIENLYEQDVANTIAKLIKTDQIEKAGFGLYKLKGDDYAPRELNTAQQVSSLWPSS
jgi:hypothetical protein